jgi:aminopeptidase N
MEPFLKYRLYDEQRQALMRAELEKLAKLENLANDLFEKVQKALDQ